MRPRGGDLTSGASPPGRDVIALLTAYLAFLLLVPAKWIVGPIGAAGTPAAIVGLAAAWWWLLGRLNPAGKLDVAAQPVRVAILTHGFVMALSYGLMWLRPLTELEINGAHRQLIGLVAISGTALLAADGILSRRHLDVLLRRLVMLGSAVAAIGAVQFFTGLDPVQLIRIPGLRLNHELLSIGGRSIFNRPFSTMAHPIEFGVVMAVLLPIALHFAFEARSAREKRLWWPCAILIAMAIPLSVSRSGVLGALIALPILGLAWSWRRRLNVAVAALAFTAATWVTVPGLVGTLRNLFMRAGDDPSIQARTERVPKVLELLSDHPWFGRGVGTFSIEDYFLVDNQYFVSAIEVGVVGLVAIVGMLMTGVVVARAVYRRSSNSVDRHLAVALSSSLAVVLVSIFTFDAFFYQTFTGLMFLALGCLGALWRFSVVGAQEPAVAYRAATGASLQRGGAGSDTEPGGPQV